MKGGRPSETALLIAKSTVATSADARVGKFITVEAAEACAWFLKDHLLLGRLRLGLFRSAWYQVFQRILESQIIPGIQLHYALRKLQLEQFANASLKRSARQVIVLGAGFDTLCLRLASQYRHVSFIEIDHPNTQALKVQSLSKRGMRPDNLNFISNDFMEKDLSAVLQDSEGIDKKMPTLIIAEGVLMYLSEQVVENLFNTFRDTF
jgi:methyltransferase (TIGR00027 family)